MKNALWTKIWVATWGDLTPMDVARVFEEVMARRGRTELEIAAIVGKFWGTAFRTREQMAEFAR